MDEKYYQNSKYRNQYIKRASIVSNLKEFDMGKSLLLKSKIGQYKICEKRNNWKYRLLIIGSLPLFIVIMRLKYNILTSEAIQHIKKMAQVSIDTMAIGLTMAIFLHSFKFDKTLEVQARTIDEIAYNSKNYNIKVNKYFKPSEFKFYQFMKSEEEKKQRENREKPIYTTNTARKFIKQKELIKSL